jgi:DNA-binding response OmpR family regulator
MADALASDGFTVLEAADGDQALAYARRLRPDVILTEVALPRLDAMGLLQAIAAERLPVRVLVHTRQSDVELRGWLLDLGAEDVLARSVDPRTIASRLRGKAISAA